MATFKKAKNFRKTISDVNKKYDLIFSSNVLEHIENAVESTDINELITTKVKKKKKHYEKGGKTCITVEVEEETNDTHAHGFQRNAFVIVALLLLIVIILIGLLFALARPC